jgi:hypothetical protein
MKPHTRRQTARPLQWNGILAKSVQFLVIFQGKNASRGAILKKKTPSGLSGAIFASKSLRSSNFDPPKRRFLDPPLFWPFLAFF